MLLLVLFACSSGIAGAVTTKTSGPKIHRGGTLDVTVTDGQWPGLYPPTDTEDIADSAYMDAIYGELFEINSNKQIVPDEAAGYKLTGGGLVFEIMLRPGLKFTDGTPLNAAAVAASINADLLPANACICGPDFNEVASVAASGNLTVVMHLKVKDSALLASFIAAAPDWTVDPTALASMGQTAYAQDPIGAGPFEVKSNEASAQLVLTKNPHYFVKGQPYLDGITYNSVSSDQSAYAAVETGQSQVMGISTVSLLEQIEASKQYSVYSSPALGYQIIQLNSFAPPFNNILAREALSYATNAKSIVANLYQNQYKVTESPSAPGQLFYEPKVPGYRSYNLAKAQALVKQLGGLNITLDSFTNNATELNECAAYKAMWAQAGINTTIIVNTLTQNVGKLADHNYQALQFFVPGLAVDNSIEDQSIMGTGQVWSGNADPVLNHLLAEGVATANTTKRAAIYQQIAARVDKEQWMLFIYSMPTHIITAKNVEGLINGAVEQHYATVWLK